jgi:hypothetical protein
MADPAENDALMTASSPSSTARGVSDTEGAGCMPAILAATVLMGIVFFIAFGFSAWLIFQKRGDLAARTLRATIIPELEQSRLKPDEKAEVVNELALLADDIEAGMYENWQAGGIMQRLINMPLMRWGDLQAVAAWAETNLPEPQREDAAKQISRFFRAVELERAIARDIHEILAPVATPEDASGFVRLRPKLTDQDVNEVVLRCKLVADRAAVPDQSFDSVSLPQIVRRQIESGRREGAR